MSKKTAYTPGDVASFLSKKSNGTAVLEEQHQLRALFDNQTRLESSPKKKKQQEAVSKIVRKNKKDSTLKAVPENKKSVSQEVEGHSKTLKKNSSSTIASSESKSRKRSKSLHDTNPISESQNSAKRPKNDSNEESSPDTEECVKKQEKKSLSENEKNAKRRLNLKGKKEFLKENDAKNQRTIFVGNVSLTVTKKTLKKLFTQFGKVEAVRIRSVPTAAAIKNEKSSKDDLSETIGSQNENTNNNGEQTKKPKKMPRRALVILKEFDPNRHSMNAYVVFETEEAAYESLKLNGTELEGLHIRVDMACAPKKHDHKSSIFVGNLPFGVEEETVRKHFDVCGEIENVRIIRNKYTGTGKGFGYVKFIDMSSVKLALFLDGKDLLGRPLRVKKAAKKPKKKKSEAATSSRTPKGKSGKRVKPKFQKRQHSENDKTTTNPSPAGKPKRPLRKYGDLKHCLHSMKGSSDYNRKKKHTVKKALRKIVREKKQLSVGKLLTGGTNSSS